MSSRIAVLIPTFKPGDYIFECLRSLESQDFDSEAFCVYVCLNGEKEPYYKELKRFSDNSQLNIRLIYIEEGNVSLARNYLLEVSKEPFIAFVDDDDLLSFNYLSSLFSVIVSKSIAVTNVVSFNESVDDITPHYCGTSFAKNYGKTSLFALRSFFSNPWGKLIDRDLVGDIRFNERISIGEDALFMAEVASRVKSILFTSKDCIYFVRQRRGSVSRRQENLRPLLLRTRLLLVEYISILFRSKKHYVFYGSRIYAVFMHVLKRAFKLT